MTPYAVLLVKPGEPDKIIRDAYLEVSKTDHPDRNGGVPGPRWYAASEAYQSIRTATERAVWTRAAELRAGRCSVCNGAGVVGTRMFKGVIKVCAACGGEGTV